MSETTAEDPVDGLANAFRAMRHAMEQSAEWRPAPDLPRVSPYLDMQGRSGRTTCAERTAIAKKAAAARWAKARQRVADGEIPSAGP